MTNPNMPNMPGMEAVADTLEFVKNLWGNMGIPGMGSAGVPGAMPGMNMSGMNIPGMVMPTLSVEEINKKIADLKAVESWLNLNMGMLRSTIQALEVQSATLGTLQSMSQTFAASMNAAKDGAASPNGHGHGSTEQAPGAGENNAAMFTAPMVNAAAWWGAMQEQFANAVGNAMSEGAKAMAPQAPGAEAQQQTGKAKRPSGTNGRAKGNGPAKDGRDSGET